MQCRGDRGDSGSPDFKPVRITVSRGVVYTWDGPEPDAGQARELTAKRNELVNRSRVAATQVQVKRNPRD